MNKNSNQSAHDLFLRRAFKVSIKHTCYLSLIILFAHPFSLAAGEAAKSPVMPKQAIVFAPTTLKAFDHSGKTVIHKILQDGSRSAEHQGTHGHVMVARLAADGRIETYCTTEESAASAWLAGEENARTAQNHVPADER